MTPTIIYKDFSELRLAYSEVKYFIESEIGGEVSCLNTKIEDDLGCAGDDNYELLKKFLSKYKLDSAGFDYSKHFLSEGELFDSGAVFWTILTLPILLVFWLVKLISFSSVDLTKRRLLPEWDRETTDLTFGDMLTWYLTGKYTLRRDVVVRLGNAV